ncbi:MAG: prepilin-type N-terminal cleavage/methylation domain-containing protein [Deltaproteobacteria bacterium]|nr:prepilin-type N-terminal cleavage/methylation domain-containing protein [Deltaproteobacteria bacterium]
MDTNDRGFTLVELLIAMAVGMIVLGAVYALFTSQSKHLANQELLTEMHQNARIAMEMMVQEISMAGYNQTTAPATIPAVNRCTGTTAASNTPCAGITNAAANTISFVADINGNGNTTAGTTNPNENITYDVYSSSGVQALGRTSNGTKQPVVENVESLNFIYYDGAGSITANLADIRSVKITIVTRTAKDDPSYTDANGHHHHHYTLSSACVIRNLGL